MVPRSQSYIALSRQTSRPNLGSWAAASTAHRDHTIIPPHRYIAGRFIALTDHLLTREAFCPSLDGFYTSSEERWAAEKRISTESGDGDEEEKMRRAKRVFEMLRSEDEGEAWRLIAEADTTAGSGDGVGIEKSDVVEMNKTWREAVSIFEHRYLAHYHPSMSSKHQRRRQTISVSEGRGRSIFGVRRSADDGHGRRLGMDPGQKVEGGSRLGEGGNEKGQEVATKGMEREEDKDERKRFSFGWPL